MSANFGELLIVMFAMILAFPLPLLPLAILWMNLITDSLPSLALSFEPAEGDVMNRKPRNPEETILDGIVYFILIAGIIAFVVSGIVFVMYYDSDLTKARTMVLSVCVFSELFLVFTCKSETKNIWETGLFSNKFLIGSVLIAFVLQLIAIYFLPLAQLFGLVQLSIGELALCIGLASSSFVFFEVRKMIVKRR